MGRVFTHIRDQKLMDMSRLPEVAIVPDDGLCAVLNVEPMSFQDLPAALARHLTPIS